MRYRVLWIDDEFKKQIDFIGAAEQENIDVIPFESHEEGIRALQSDSNYHAVILDAKVKNKKADTVTNLTGLRASRDFLIKYNETNYLPFFIFTGQPDYAKEEWFRESYGEYFLKGRDNDELFEAIKDHVLNKSEYLIERKYKKVFEACVDEFFGKSSRKILMNALKILEGYQKVDNTDELLTSIRKIYEKIFAAFHRRGFIPDEVYKNNGWINNSSKFLAGAHHEYSLLKEVYPSTISFIAKNVLFITQDGSHNEGSLKLEVVEHINNLNTSYLYNSLVLQTLDVICWAKRFLDEHPNLDENRKFWTKNGEKEVNHGDWIKGKITDIKDNGWGSFTPKNSSFPELGIPPSMIESNGLSENLSILVTTRPGKNPNQPYVDKIKIDLN